MNTPKERIENAVNRVILEMNKLQEVMNKSGYEHTTPEQRKAIMSAISEKLVQTSDIVKNPPNNGTGFKL